MAPTRGLLRAARVLSAWAAALPWPCCPPLISAKKWIIDVRWDGERKCSLYHNIVTSRTLEVLVVSVKLRPAEAVRLAVCGDGTRKHGERTQAKEEHSRGARSTKKERRQTHQFGFRRRRCALLSLTRLALLALLTLWALLGSTAIVALHVQLQDAGVVGFGLAVVAVAERSLGHLSRLGWGRCLGLAPAMVQ